MAIETDPELREQVVESKRYADTDEDGLLDLEEIYYDRNGKAVVKFDQNGKVILPTFKECMDLEDSLFYVKSAYDRYEESIGKQLFAEKLSGIHILPIKSDPTLEDGDGDGILDKFDKEALRENVHSDYIIDCINTGKIKFEDMISDEQISICTVPITELRFIIEFKPKVCYDAYGDPYALDPFEEKDILAGYFDNWYIVEDLTGSKVETGLIYTKDCQKFIDIHSSPFRHLIKAIDVYPEAMKTIYDGYVEDGFWVTTKDVISGAVSSHLESMVEDAGLLADMTAAVKKSFVPSGRSDAYFPDKFTYSDIPDIGSEQSYHAQLTYEYQLFEKTYMNVDSDTFQAAKTLGYSNQIIEDTGVILAGVIVGTSGDMMIGGGFSLAPVTGGTSLAFAIPGIGASAIGGGVTVAGMFLMASDLNGFNNASDAFRDAEMFGNKNLSLTEPSKSCDENAEPSGRKTKIRDKMDDTTRTSIEIENETARIIAKNGYDIEQNPTVSNTSRKPDYKIEGKIFDCYAPTSNTSVKNIWYNIEEKVVTKAQTKRIVLNLDRWTGEMSDLKAQFADYEIGDLEEILIVKGNKVFRFYPIS